jgi:hypothetical protein
MKVRFFESNRQWLWSAIQKDPAKRYHDALQLLGAGRRGDLTVNSLEAIRYRQLKLAYRRMLPP